MSTFTAEQIQELIKEVLSVRKRIFKKAVSVMLTAGMLAAAVFTQPVLADSERVVTLGADLSKEDQKLILKYFGVPFI